MESNNTQSNAKRFLDAYARIEKKLYEIIRETKYIPFSQMITRASRDNLIISSRANDLRQYHELRNAIALGIMSLIVIVSVLLSGLTQNDIGYRQFFILTTGFYIVPIVVAAVNVFMFRK